MNEVLHGGTTVIFVSHNLRAITDLCHRCVLLDHGQVLSVGPTNEVVRKYMDRVSENRGTEKDKAVEITELAIRSAQGESVTFKAGEKARIDIEMKAHRPTEKLALILSLQDDSYYEVFNTSSERLGIPPISLEAGESYRCTFEVDLHLSAGAFHLGATAYRYDIQKAYDSWFPLVTIFVKSPIDVRGAANLYPSIVSQEKSGATNK
jgi:ABC-type molybdate transport system ATPase subunit